MRIWIDRAQSIPRLDEDWLRKGQQRLDEQTRPQGSLGRLEGFITRLVAIQKKEPLELSRKRILIFAADHGVECEGVSRYPRAVTQAMVINFLNGGATVNALARHAGADVRIVDVGIDGEVPDHEGLIKAKVRKGTRNLKIESAMSLEETHRALEVGWAAVEAARREGVQMIGLGEMGIGNTTPATAIIAVLLNRAAEEVAGRGTGVDDEGFRRKIRVIEEAIRRHQGHLHHPLGVLQALGGLEIAAMSGAILACSHYSLPVVVDGIVVAASMLVCHRLNPVILDYVFLSHESHERGHRYVLEAFKQTPILNLSMRLGEASGAALALTVLEAGVKIYNEVATFAEASVAHQRERAQTIGLAG
jgi:nicotinate-nucleotide--dimethylbenzimidazole phosphoribosyltransferase